MRFVVFFCFFLYNVTRSEKIDHFQESRIIWNGDCSTQSKTTEQTWFWKNFL